MTLWPQALLKETLRQINLAFRTGTGFLIVFNLKSAQLERRRISQWSSLTCMSQELQISLRPIVRLRQHSLLHPLGLQSLTIPSRLHRQVAFRVLLVQKRDRNGMSLHQ